MAGMEGMEAGESLTGSESTLKLCLHVLHNAQTDTEKFAALLVVSKSVKPGECSTEDRKQILNAAGISFFVRLLRTDTTPEGCTALVFKSVAVNVLLALLEDPQVACLPDMKKVVPRLWSIIKADIRKEPADERESLGEIQQDVYRLVARVACTRPGGQLLLDCGCVTTLVQVLISQPEEEGMMRPMGILILLIRQFGAALWKGVVPAYRDLFAFLAKYITNSNDGTMFGVCELLTFIMNTAPQSKTLSKSLQPLMEKLSSMLQSRLGVAQRQCVLVLVNSLVVSLGVECVLPPMVPDSKLFQLLLHLTCVEVRMATENSTAEQMHKAASSLVSHYHALEVMLTFLCGNDDDHDLPLDASAFSQAHDALLHACNGVFYLLQQVDKGELALPLLHPVVVSSVGFVAGVTAQAFTEVKASVAHVLPLLVLLCKMEVNQLEQCVPAEDGDQSHAGKTRGSEKATARPVNSSATSTAAGSSAHLSGVSSSDSAKNIRGNSASQMDTTVSDGGENTPTASSSNQDHKDACSSEKDQTVASSEDRGGANTHTSNSTPVTQNSADTHARARGSVSGQSGTMGLGSAMEVEDTSGEVVRDEDELPTMTEEDVLATSLDGLLMLTHRLSQPGLPAMHSLQVIRWLLPVYHLAIEDDETRQVFVSLCGYEPLVQSVLQKHSSLLTSDGYTLQEQLGEVCQTLEVLMELLGVEENDVMTEHCMSLLELAVTTVPTLGDKLYAYRAFLTGAGLALMRVKVCRGGSALKPLVVQVPELVDSFLQRDFISTVIRLLRQQESHIERESVPVVMDFVQTLTSLDQRARAAWEQVGGAQLARVQGGQ
ncbi:neurochondrin-like isoform X2 [Littorina saxatilis]|uniref:neurochondrin-like isoform X2 n=1 Tax=Littorina saxatilis TaxID=31220 RepID=UPI0038B60176